MIYSFKTLRDIVYHFIYEFGGFLLMFCYGIRALFSPPYRIRMIFKQMEFIGVNSSFIIILTGIFTGAVLALQSGKAFRMVNAEGMTGAMVTISLLRELGPVMASLMVTARCGSAMAAELGTMRVTQQIDALKVMAVDPVGYLISPRILAALCMLPLLTVIFNLMGMLGGYLIAVGILDIGSAIYFDNIKTYATLDDLWSGVVKASVFGVIIAVVGCRRGYLATGGAEGVGRATTQAVVIASVTILVADYFLTALMF